MHYIPVVFFTAQGIPGEVDERPDTAEGIMAASLRAIGAANRQQQLLQQQQQQQQAAAAAATAAAAAAAGLPAAADPAAPPPLPAAATVAPAPPPPGAAPAPAAVAGPGGGGTSPLPPLLFDTEEAEYAWLPLDCIKPFTPGDVSGNGGVAASADPNLQVCFLFLFSPC